jgi:hypothetical protein
MLSSLVSSSQAADNTNCVTLLAARGVLVRGIYNQVFLEDVFTVEQATAKLHDLGYAPSRQWLTSQYGSQETFIHRTA